MAILPTSPSSLELTISVPGFASSPSLPSSEGGAYGVRNLDINQVPLTMEEEEEESSGGPPRKKLRLTKEQSRLLEESFRENHTLNPKQKEALAYQLKLLPRQVEVWFQNRRARTKLKQTELECEYLKRCFGSLTEENRRLHREVEQLRALRVGPPTVISPNTCEPLPASTLTMCPRCERVTTTASGTGTTFGTTTSGTSTATLDKHGPTASKSLSFSRQPSAAC